MFNICTDLILTAVLLINIFINFGTELNILTIFCCVDWRIQEGSQRLKFLLDLLNCRKIVFLSCMVKVQFADFVLQMWKLDVKFLEQGKCFDF